MYCAGCGSPINAELNYCKSCGMRLSIEEKTEYSNRVLPLMIVTFGVVTVVGLGVLLALIALLLDRGATEKIFGIIIVFYLASLTAIEYVLGSQISKLISANIGKEKRKVPEIVQPAQLFAPNTAQLSEHRESIGSVTENTTRTFDKIPLGDN
ncbi:hypothetical protein BH10ACI1_BH10ACI1_12890 [soil metagenome]